MITGGRTGGVAFRLFGVPVTIHLTSVLFLGLLGFGIGDPILIAVWIAVGIVAIVLHELGHALVGRRFGLVPRVDVAGLGGVTTWAGSVEPLRTRGRSIAISVAGPGVGIVCGLAAIAAGAPWRGIPVNADVATFAAAAWVFVSLGWGVLNLLPVLPLDGGRILAELLPGAPRVRQQRAAAVGVVVAGAVAAWAITVGFAFAAIVLGLFAWNNLKLARGPASTSASDEPGIADARAALASGEHLRALQVARQVVQRRGADAAWSEVAVVAMQGLLDSGADQQAVAAASDPVLEVLLDEVTVARALARHADRDEVLAHVDRELADHQDARRRGIAALVRAHDGDHADADRVLQSGPVSPHVSAAVRALRQG